MVIGLAADGSEVDVTFRSAMGDGVAAVVGEPGAVVAVVVTAYSRRALLFPQCDAGMRFRIPAGDIEVPLTIFDRSLRDEGYAQALRGEIAGSDFVDITEADWVTGAICGSHSFRLGEDQTSALRDFAVARAGGIVEPGVQDQAPTAVEPVFQEASPPAAVGGPVQVRGYYRRDGTYVRPHTRRRPRR